MDKIVFFFLELTLENTEGAIKNGLSREIGNKTKKNNPKATTQHKNRSATL